MAHLVQSPSLSDAWLQGLELLVDRPSGKAVNLNVAFPSAAQDALPIRIELDSFLVEHELRSIDGELLSVETVANTIFPEALYHPDLGVDAAPRLYENYELSMRIHRRRKWDKDTYFNRLMAYPVADGQWNQLDYYVKRLRTQRATLRRSSSYELGVSHPLDAELRIQAPFKDKRMGSFPCLSHISLTLAEDQVHMTATYRNQTFISRAYGNYLGLTRLLRFISAETGAQPGEIQVAATHADAELGVGKAAIKSLVARCRQLSDVDRKVAINV
jgi:hypothetical protein